MIFDGLAVGLFQPDSAAATPQSRVVGKDQPGPVPRLGTQSRIPSSGPTRREGEGGRGREGEGKASEGGS